MSSRSAITELQAILIICFIVATGVGGYYYYYYYVVTPKPAEFRVTNLIINSAEARVGETISTSVNMTNIGEGAGSYTVNLTINGTIEQSKTIVLEGGASTTVEFKVVKEKAGSYAVKIDGLTGTFKIIVPPTPPSVTVAISDKIDETGTILEDIKVVSSDGMVTLIIPKGTKAVDGEGKPLKSVTIEPVEPPIAPVKGLRIEFAYNLLPEGATFNPSIKLALHYDETKLSGAGITVKRIAPYYYNTKTQNWDLISGERDIEANTITFWLDCTVRSIGSYILEEPCCD